MIGIIGIVLIFTGFLISIVLLLASKNNHNVPSPKKNNGKYAILIPARNESKVISHPSFNRSSYEVVIVEPHSFSEAGSIVQNLIDRKTVVLNLHLLDKDQSQRTIDFVCGASHALNGNKPQQVGEMVFVFAPSNVTMSVDAQNSSSKFADIWGKSL